MPVTEMQRTDLINRLVEVLGEERTETLMQCILPEGREQLATKDDLKLLENTLRSESKGEFAELRGKLAELRAYIDSALAKQNRHFTFMFIGFVASNWAAMVPLILAT